MLNFVAARSARSQNWHATSETWPKIWKSQKPETGTFEDNAWQFDNAGENNHDGSQGQGA